MQSPEDLPFCKKAALTPTLHSPILVLRFAITGIYVRKNRCLRKKGGIGLGTYMAHLVLMAHNGQIDFEASEVKGTEVLMMLAKT